MELPESDPAHDLIRIATLCNRAHFRNETDPGPVYSKTTVGDASESALLKFVEVIHRRAGDPPIIHTPLSEIPFNSTTKYQVAFLYHVLVFSSYIATMHFRLRFMKWMAQEKPQRSVTLWS